MSYNSLAVKENPKPTIEGFKPGASLGQQSLSSFCGKQIRAQSSMTMLSIEDPDLGFEPKTDEISDSYEAFKRGVPPAWPRMSGTTMEYLDDDKNHLQKASYSIAGEPDKWRAAEPYKGSSSDCGTQRMNSSSIEFDQSEEPHSVSLSDIRDVEMLLDMAAKPQRHDALRLLEQLNVEPSTMDSCIDEAPAMHERLSNMATVCKQDTIEEWLKHVPQDLPRELLSQFDALEITAELNNFQPQSKRLRSTFSNRYDMDNLKRYLLMPDVPSVVEPELQLLHILRQPIKRKASRGTLQIEMQGVKAYTLMQVNGCLDLDQLATKLDNSVYQGHMQVLQKSYDDDKVAWMWSNGSILIINAGSPSNVAQEDLLGKIPAGSGSLLVIKLAQENAVSYDTVHVTQFPWHICLAEFSQCYALSKHTFQGLDPKYALYVNSYLPGVAAKVFETGAIHVFANSTAKADSMLEELYLLTASNRIKPQTGLKSNLPF